MKKIFTLFTFVIGFGLTNAQTSTNIVTGTVTDCLGAPVSGHAVYVSTDSTSGVFYWNTVYTNALGVYADTVPYNTLLGGVQPIFVSTYDIAPGTGWYYITENPTSAGNTYINDFSINCATPATCSASFYSYEDSTGVNDTTYLVLSVSSASPASTTITWDYGDGGTGTSGSTTHVYAANGVYYVCVTIFDASDSCTFTYCDSVGDYFRSGFVLKTIYTPSLTINENQKLNNVKVYPNPTQGEVFISSPTLSDAKTIIIYDIAGRPVSVINNNGNSTNARLDISNIENGSYILVLVDATNKPLYTHPLIKH